MYVSLITCSYYTQNLNVTLSLIMMSSQFGANHFPFLWYFKKKSLLYNIWKCNIVLTRPHIGFWRKMFVCYTRVSSKKPKAISHGQILDSLELNYLPYISTICKAYPNHLNWNLAATQLSDSAHTKQRPLGMTAAIHYFYTHIAPHITPDALFL